MGSSPEIKLIKSFLGVDLVKYTPNKAKTV
jgi:hypothetical protein